MVYNSDYWTKKVLGYMSEDWSLKPTPFAKLSLSYLPKVAHILELGTGAGQDGLWFASENNKVVATDATDSAFEMIRIKANKDGIDSLQLEKLDITGQFSYADESFDAVYANLVLHYFDDDMMQFIMNEIKRVLKPGGILACMMNSNKDPEYDEGQLRSDGLQEVNGITKRFFDLTSFKPFTEGFKVLLFDDKGSTPKDDKKSTFNLIEFIGRKL